MKNKVEFIDAWWSRLTVSEKEAIASKVFGTPVKYPECTGVWLNLEKEKKQWVYEHCSVNAYGITVPKFDEGSFND